MKNIFLLLFIVPFLNQAQYFSGEIVYEINIIPKSDSVNLNEIIDLKHGTIVSYVITSKQYKSTYFKDGKYNYSYTYDDETKRMFDDYANKPYLTFRNSEKANADYFGSKIFKDSTETILGYESYMVITESEFGISKTYYSEDIKVNYADFEGHKVGNWYNKLKEVDGAITLKTVTEFENYIEVQEAVKVNARIVNVEEFELPNKPVAASFTALDKQVEMKQPTPEQIKCYQQKVGAVSKNNGKKFTSYVTFLLQKGGEIKYLEPYQKDEDGFYKTSMDIIKNCGFQFIPGKIEGLAVDSQVYFPVEFLKP